MVRTARQRERHNGAAWATPLRGLAKLGLYLLPTSIRTDSEAAPARPLTQLQADPSAGQIDQQRSGRNPLERAANGLDPRIERRTAACPAEASADQGDAGCRGGRRFASSACARQVVHVAKSACFAATSDSFASALYARSGSQIAGKDPESSSAVAAHV